MSKPDLNRPLLPVYFPFSLSRHTTNSVIMKPVSPLRHISTTSVPPRTDSGSLNVFSLTFFQASSTSVCKYFLFHLHSIAFYFVKVTGVLPIHQSNFPFPPFFRGKSTHQIKLYQTAYVIIVVFQHSIRFANFTLYIR